MNKFSIIVPAYNAEKYLKNSLDSIINLKYPRDLMEVLIIDDGSTDSTKNIINSYVEKFEFIKYFYKTNSNWGSVINFAKNNRLINGDYVAILDADDFYLEDCLNIINNILENNDDIDCVISSYYEFDGNKNKKKVYPFFGKERILKEKEKNTTPFSNPIIYFTKKSIFYNTKNLVEGISHQDLNLATQITNKSKNIYFTRNITSKYFFNREGNTMTRKWDQKRFDQYYIVCLNIIENGSYDLLGLQLWQKQFRNLVKKNNCYFTIPKKLKYYWFPWYLKPIFFSIMYFINKKYIKVKK